MRVCGDARLPYGGIRTRVVCTVCFGCVVAAGASVNFYTETPREMTVGANTGNKNDRSNRRKRTEKGKLTGH